MILPILILIAAALLVSASLFKHTHLLTYIAVAMGAWEAQWLLLTLLDRAVLQQTSSEAVYLIGSLVLAGLAYGFTRIKSPSLPLGRKKHDIQGDIAIGAVVILTLIGAWTVLRVNGFSENEWVTHGFYSGDTAVFMSLTRKSFDTISLVSENPFAGNTSLEYPTVIHAGVAALLPQSTGSWLYYLPSLTLTTIVLTIPLFFLIWRLYGDSPTKRWLMPSAIILLIMTASWDSFIYPQSHFFITGLFLLLVAVILQSQQERKQTAHIYNGIGGVLTLILMLSNAVTGTAALVVFGIHTLIQMQANVSTRAWYAGGIGMLTLLFLLFTPGNGSIGGLGFSYTAAGDMLRLSPLLALLFVGVYMNRSSKQRLTPHVASLTALAFILFFFSTRDIVVANASRFFYHALLIGFPLLAAPLTHIFKKVKPLIMSNDLTVKVSYTLLTLSGIGLFLMPSALSVASAYDNLLFKDTQVVDTALRSALWWIEDNTSSDAVFLASPNAPFAIPQFTGRAILRSDYWLSPGDIVQEDVVQSFAGDGASQEQVLTTVDYILLTKEERTLFEPLSEMFKKVYDNNAVVIYQRVGSEVTSEL